MASARAPFRAGPEPGGAGAALRSEPELDLAASFAGPRSARGRATASASGADSGPGRDALPGAGFAAESPGGSETGRGDRFSPAHDPRGGKALCRLAQGFRIGPRTAPRRSPADPAGFRRESTSSLPAAGRRTGRQDRASCCVDVPARALGTLRPRRPDCPTTGPPPRTAAPEHRPA